MNRFIEKTEQSLGIFSSVEIYDLPVEIKEFLSKKSVELVYIENELNLTNDLIWKNLVYKTKQNFYLYLSKKENDKCTVIVYYQASQSDELKIFIKLLLKEFNHGTINNRTT